MNKELQFMVFCIEEYRGKKGLSGKEVADLFRKYSVLEYVRDFYDVLHINGSNYIIDDIYEFIESKRATVS